MSKMFLEKFTKIASTLPDDSEICVYNLPKGITSREEKIPHVKRATYLESYSIQSWLKMNLPYNHMKVFLRVRPLLYRFPQSLNLHVKRERGKKVVVRLIFDIKRCRVK